MKNNFLLLRMVVFVLFCSMGLQAQTTQKKLHLASLDNTEQFYLTSNFVKGEKYRIQVSLPPNYATAKKTYPVYYFADGDVAFGMIKGIADLLMMGNDIKEIIVVGIGYGQGLNNWFIKRTRDLTPTIDTLLNQGYVSGGADNFLKFIKNELFPKINKNYRTNPDSTAIGGAYLGGLLNSYILFNQHELFKNYVIGSPFLIWDKKIISKLENEYFSKHKELNCNVYIYYGSMDFEDGIIIPTNEFIQNIQSHNYKGINLITKIYEGETHYSVSGVAITHGLRTLFHP